MANKTYRFLFKYLKKNILKGTVGLFFTLLHIFSIFLSPYISKYLLDDALILKDIDKLYTWLILFFIACLFQPINEYIKNSIFFKISEDTVLAIRNDLLKKILFAPMNLLDNMQKGAVISRILNDVRNISDFTTNLFVVFARNVILVLTIFIGMITLSWRISIAIIFLLIIYILYSTLVNKKFEKLSKNCLTNNDILCKNLGDSLDNISLIKAFDLTQLYYEKNSEILKNIYSNNLFTDKLKTKFEALSSIVMLFSLSLIYGFGSFLVVKEYITIGTLFALSLYFQILIYPIRELVNNNIKYREIVPSIDRLEEYLTLKEENNKIDVVTNEILLKENTISFENISFNYIKNNEKICALKNINFSFKGNGLYGIVGQSGSGKSTLAKLILGLYLPYQGNLDILVNKERVFNIHKLRNSISYASQDMEFLNASIMENLKTFRNDILDKKVIKICKTLNLDKTISRLPLGYFNIIDEKVNLSGGEKQRFSIARAVLKKSPIYLFDEITSALDRNNQNVVNELIEKLSKNSIIIFITHKVSLLKNAKNIIVLDNGNIVQSGVYSQLSELDGTFKNVLLKSQLNKEEIINVSI